MNLSRRTFLAASSTAALAAAFASAFGSVAVADEGAANDFATLRNKWVDIISGRNFVKDNPGAYADSIQSLDNAAQKILADIVRDDNRTTVLASSNLSEEKSPALTKTSRAALSLAVCWAMPGSRYYQNKDVLTDSINALADLLRLRYNPNQPEYGNWWDWESGASRAVGDLMCVLHDELPEEVLTAAKAAIDHFVSDPTQQGRKPGAETIPSTGANRLDLCRAVICSAIATDDAPRLAQALAGLDDTWAFVETSDGFYRDGSYIQHHHVPYTGAYGDVLLNGWSLLFELVAGSPYDIAEDKKQKVFDAVDNSFVPVMVDGQVLDAVRGRSVSRLTESGSFHGTSIMLAMLRLANAASEETAQRWRSLISGWISRNTYNDFTNTKNIVQRALITTVANETPSEGIHEPRMFASMDRLVHRGNGWTAAISMCSNRISWYEYGNGENEWGSRTGSGMRYLYLPENMGQFEDAFWPTLNYSAPVGTTVDTNELQPKVGVAWGEDTPNNEWTGGVTSDVTSTAGMHLVGPDSNGLSARRAWMASPSVLVEAVTDVRTTADHAYTVVEARNLGENSSASLLVDGNAITDLQTLTNPSWAHLEGVGGYVFLTDVILEASVAPRTGKWADLNTRSFPGNDVELTRTWATMHALHSAESTRAAWVLLPGADLEATKAYADSLKGDAPEAVVRENSADAQVISLRQGGTSWNVWKPGTYADLRFNQPTVLLAEALVDEGTIDLTVADPTQGADSVTVTMPGMWEIVRGAENVLASTTDNETSFQVSTSGLLGSSVLFTVKPVGQTPVDPADPTPAPSESAAPAPVAPSATPSAAPSAHPTAEATVAATVAPKANKDLASTGANGLLAVAAVAAVAGGVALTASRKLN
ncbi:polysaccharide lyase 8 family protein [Actinomyces vulturis]|uniref:polysaccharide lyase 8 family protein n=1 Tax=Actinomyces vulturis TaxID=1857645 RepID=UPI000833699A|nr:polysaccharide lyase 8 family protein [Actinomyces vulturis]